MPSRLYLRDKRGVRVLKISGKEKTPMTPPSRELFDASPWKTDSQRSSPRTNLLSKSDQTPERRRIILRLMGSPTTFKTNDEIPRSGVYRVFHIQHPMQEICLLKDTTFPACPQCSSPIRFTLISAIPIESAAGRFRLLMQARCTRRHVLLEPRPNYN